MKRELKFDSRINLTGYPTHNVIQWKGNWIIRSIPVLNN